MFLGILVGLLGLGFLFVGIIYNEKGHKKGDSSGIGADADSLIGAIIVETFIFILAKLPYWVTKTLFLLIAIAFFYWSYSIFRKII